jgi:hypothetical protein
MYCDRCYASEDLEDEDRHAAEAEGLEESEEYIDLELMDVLDTEDDAGLF